MKKQFGSKYIPLALLAVPVLWIAFVMASGYEDGVRRLLEEKLRPYAQEIRIDDLKNIKLAYRVAGWLLKVFAPVM